MSIASASSGALIAGVLITSGLRLPEAQPDVVSGAAHERIAPVRGPLADLDDALRHARAGDWEDAVAAFEAAHAEDPAAFDAAAWELYGDALAELDRRDEAADAWDRGLSAMLDAGGTKSSKEYRALRDRVREIDPVAQQREACVNKVMNLLFPATEELVTHEHWERALDFLERLDLIAAGERGASVDAMLEDVRKRFQTVDLDSAASDEQIDAAAVKVTSRRYEIVANLERPIAELVGDVMDDIYDSYVQIYFEGDESRAIRQKVTIRIYPSHAKMMEEWQGPPNEGIGGWWDPARGRVVCYDTRTNSGTLDAMLETLFHEASHQFMFNLVVRGNGKSPAWINEGTASFFEGATAMADRRVLWPHAARQRLISLTRYRNIGEDLSLQDVLSYDQPGSYPGEYYAYGWGLVYFLQEYEDPETLEKVWRPYYSRYLRRITTEQTSPLDLFEEVVLAPGNPGGFDTVNEFAEFWRDWIVNEVLELHFGDDRREMRLERIEAYLSAADERAAAGGSRGEIEDLMLRAFREAEYVRANIDDPERPEGEIVEQQIAILSRLERAASEAAKIEELLDLVDAGLYEIDEDDYDGLEDRMNDIDKENVHPRAAKAKARNLRDQARAVLEAYEALEEPLPHRAASFARRMGTVLDDRKVLLPAADRLESSLRGVGSAIAAGASVDGQTWRPLFPSVDAPFESSAGSVSLEAVGETAGRICTDVAVREAYAVRGVLMREGDTGLRSSHGVVVGGAPAGPWLVVKVDGRGRVRVDVWTLEDGEATEDNLERIVLDEPVEEDEHPPFEVLVDPAGSLTITLGARAPIEVDVEGSFEFPTQGHVGVFAEDALTRLVGLKVEQL